MVPNELHILKSYFDANKHLYNFILKSDCGVFTERFLVHLRTLTGNKRFVHLRKYGNATQYNKHAIDVILFDNRGLEDGTPFMEVDILGAAESSGAHPTWQDRDTPYLEKDMMQPEEVGMPVPEKPKFPTYEGMGGDRFAVEKIGKILEEDYTEAEQSLNAGSATWFWRTAYDAFYWIVVEGMAPTEAVRKSVEKRRPEWREALGLK